MMKHEQQTSRREKSSTFFGGNNFSRLNLYTKVLSTLISMFAAVATGYAVEMPSHSKAESSPCLAGSPALAASKPGWYAGKFCEGAGDIDYLKLIDESFAFFHSTPLVPNLTMVYKAEWDSFSEGANWGQWWVQNSYGFSYAATPFLQEPWFSTLQHSWDFLWNNQADGKRQGKIGIGPSNPNDSPLRQVKAMVAPDGCLGDSAQPDFIAYKACDGKFKIHDWFYEATAAVVVVQAEILLASRDRKALAHYLPKMVRACDAIEKTRDSANNLFLVGPASNLLANSYGGIKQPDGTFGKGYLAGLSITYLAALDRMVELYKLVGDKEKLAEYEHRQKITRESLPCLLAPAGYFVKSVETGGLKHGVLGQEKFGYLEGVANADAVALRVANDETARQIYRQIEAFPSIRPFDFLLTNAPGLDDTYLNYGSSSNLEAYYCFMKFGDWVNGGVWGTVEGRAILMYYRLGKFRDIRRSAERAMKWAKDFRMDAPWSQFGENTHNPWSDSGDHQVGGVVVMIDNFAIPAATVRGLFDYEYRSDCLVLRPRIPGSISQYVQKQPVRFGEKTIYLSCRNGGPKVKSIEVNGNVVKVESPDAAFLLYDDLPLEAKVEIVTEGGWDASPGEPSAPSIQAASPVLTPQAELPESLKKPYTVLMAMGKLLNQEQGAEYEKAFVIEAIGAIEAWQIRSSMDAGPGCFRPMTPEKRASILKFYENAAICMYHGFANRMKGYAKSPSADKKHLAELFQSLR